jgi:hypothetical protein
MLIGLTGLKQSGKTTAGDFLAHKYKFEHTSFAAPMRKFAMDVLCMNETQLEFCKEQPLTFLDRQVTPRKFLQLLGTEFGREMIHPDLWVRSCLMKIDVSKNTVVSDVRFCNEAHAIRSMGGKIVQITRRGQVAGVDAHASEQGIHPALIDYTISNNGERVEAFYADIDSFVRSLRSGDSK